MEEEGIFYFFVHDNGAHKLIVTNAISMLPKVAGTARIVYSTLVGVDPVTMLKGPIPATRKVLAKTGRLPG